MNRKEVSTIISRFSSPVTMGESKDSRDKEFDKWIQNLDLRDIDIFIDLILHSPNKEEMNAEQYEFMKNYDQLLFETMFECNVIYALVGIGKNDSTYLISKLTILLIQRRLWNFVIEIIGLLENQEYLPLLESFIEYGNLNRDELCLVIDALFEIGGEMSFEILNKMQQKFQNNKYIIDYIQKKLDCFRY